MPGTDLSAGGRWTAADFAALADKVRRLEPDFQAQGHQVREQLAMLEQLEQFCTARQRSDAGGLVAEFEILERELRTPQALGGTFNARLPWLAVVRWAEKL